MKTEIRKLKESDYVQWLKLWQEYQQFYHVDLTEELSKLTFSRLIKNEQNMGCFVIQKESQLLGFVHYIYHFSTWTTGNYCYLQDLFIDMSQRAQGLGKQLIEAVYSEAKKQECSRVYWLTHEDNHIARKLYDQVADNIGFIQYRKNIN